MAAAIILIPEMLSGPDRAEHPTQAVARAPSETGLKTYSIDLNNPPGTSNAQAVPDERAPPPEDMSPAPERTQEAQSNSQTAASTSSPEDESNPEPAPQSSPTPQASQQTARVSSTPADVQAPPAKPAAAKPVETPPAKAPLASENSVPTSRGWAVQLGSFSSRASAEKLAAEFRAGRDDVFVMPVKSGATTLYRVRIGPMQDRAAAEDTLRRVKTKVSGAAVVAHP